MNIRFILTEAEFIRANAGITEAEFVRRAVLGHPLKSAPSKIDASLVPDSTESAYLSISWPAPSIAVVPFLITGATSRTTSAPC